MSIGLSQLGPWVLINESWHITRLWCEAEVRDAMDSCKPEKIKLPKDFVTRKDVNGDGVPDFIVDGSVLLCNGTRSGLRERRGCQITVYASLPNGTYTKALDKWCTFIRSVKLMAARAADAGRAMLRQ